ncbi:hypothetical protein LXA43DRAFT_1063380 [Ganoderma leucocontextum]|nr:hypothetical protein LXA43DRAFT_1063380 [Ganoderma leucocontextum]
MTVTVVSSVKAEYLSDTQPSESSSPMRILVPASLMLLMLLSVAIILSGTSVYYGEDPNVPLHVLLTLSSASLLPPAANKSRERKPQSVAARNAHFPMSENLLFDFDWQSVCNQDGMDEMLDFEALNCSQESFTLVPYGSTGADNQTPAYDKVLQIFLLVSLNTQLLKFEQLAHLQSKVPDVMDGDKLVEIFLNLFRLGNQFCPVFISEVINIWTSIHKQMADLSLWSFKLAMECRHIMLCTAAAWY